MREFLLRLMLPVSFLAGCATVDSDFRRTQTKDAIRSYEDFLKQHPESKYTQAANDRLKVLYEISEKGNRLRLSGVNNGIEKIRNYEVAVLTEAQFLDEGWNARAAFFNKLGIVELVRTETQSEFKMGLIHISNPHNISGLREQQAEKAQTKFQNRLEEKNNSNWKPDNQSTIYCVVIFERGILKSKNCQNPR